MSLFSIDQKKCKRDGICAAECPAQIIVQADKKSFPSLLEGGEEFCINCGHCVAVCPHGAHGACRHAALTACPPIDKRHASRRRLRLKHLLHSPGVRPASIKKPPVPRKLLAELLDVARYAPTGSNKQQVHWTGLSEARRRPSSGGAGG